MGLRLITFWFWWWLVLAFVHCIWLVWFLWRCSSLSLLASLVFGLLAATLMELTTGHILLDGVGIGALLALLASALGYDGSELILSCRAAFICIFHRCDHAFSDSALALQLPCLLL